MKKKHIKILTDISKNIPKELTEKLLIWVEVSPTIKKVLEEAVKDLTLPEEKRIRWQNLLDTGELNQKEQIEDPAIVKEIEKYLEDEIEKEVKKGTLPSKIEGIKKAKQKIKKHD
jgi:hypothetical protein